MTNVWHMRHVVVPMEVATSSRERDSHRLSDALGCLSVAQPGFAYRYERLLADAAIGGQPVRIRLRVRHYTCPRSGCARRTFVEQVAGLTMRYGRHSQLLRRTLE
jgi:hypothetical protein